MFCSQKFKFHTLLTVIAFTQVISCSSPGKPKTISSNVPANVSSVSEFGFVAPDTQTTEHKIDHKYFQIHYDAERRLARYVTYELKRKELLKKSFKRKDKFRVDPFLIKNQLPVVKPSEYARTGYDKGHLAPAADFSWSEEASDLTFVMTNMVPQKPGLNRDSWKRLEEKVRRWACGEGSIYVITGPVLASGLSKLKSGLEVPNQFFKIVIDQTPPQKTISFIYNQTDKGEMVMKNLASLKSIETITKLSFNQYFKGLKVSDLRAPANLNEWKEADCKGK